MCSAEQVQSAKVQRCRSCAAEQVQRFTAGADMEVEVEVKVVVIAYFYSARGAEVLSWC